EAQLHPRIEETPSVGPSEPEGAKPVEHHAHPRAAARGPIEGVAEAGGHGTRAHQIHLEQHVAARPVDRREHAREKLAAVVQETKLVSESPPPAGGCNSLEIRRKLNERTMTAPRIGCQTLLLAALFAPLGAAAETIDYVNSVRRHG